MMRHFDCNIKTTYGSRSILDHARKNNKFFCLRYLQAPWHHVLHIPPAAGVHDRGELVKLLNDYPNDKHQKQVNALKFDGTE